MITGKRYRLNSPTVAIETDDGRRVATTLPSGTTIEVASGPHDRDTMVHVIWQGRVVAMFAVDLNERGTEVE